MNGQPPLKQIIGGAIYDFAASLTRQKQAITMGANHNAAPLAQACNEFLKLRGCDSGEPLVKSWQDHLGTIGHRCADAPTFEPEFRAGLEMLINLHSMENGSGTPDFILATYLADCLGAFDKALTHREQWYGRAPVAVPKD